MRFNKSLLISLLGVLLIISLTSVTAGMFDSNNNSNSDITVENITVTSEGYGMYEVNCAITPKKDFNYLEMQVIFYDNSGAVIGKSPLVWNMNDITKDQLIKASGSAFTNSDSSRPAKAEIIIVDSSFGDSSKSIFSENVTMS